MWSSAVLTFLIAAVCTAAEEAASKDAAVPQATPRHLGIVYFVQLLNGPPREQYEASDLEEGVSNHIPSNDFTKQSPVTGLLLIRPLLVAATPEIQPEIQPETTQEEESQPAVLKAQDESKERVKRSPGYKGGGGGACCGGGGGGRPGGGGHGGGGSGSWSQSSSSSSSGSFGGGYGGKKYG